MAPTALIWRSPPHAARCCPRIIAASHKEHVRSGTNLPNFVPFLHRAGRGFSPWHCIARNRARFEPGHKMSNRDHPPHRLWLQSRNRRPCRRDISCGRSEDLWRDHVRSNGKGHGHKIDQTGRANWTCGTRVAYQSLASPRSGIAVCAGWPSRSCRSNRSLRTSPTPASLMASLAGWLVSVFFLLSIVTLMSSSVFGIRAKP